MEDNSIDISHLKKVELTVSNLIDIVTVLECTASILVLPLEVTEALERLRKLVEK